MFKLQDRFKTFLRSLQSGPDGKVRDAREFAAVLNRERDRADRTGMEFSLIAFARHPGGQAAPAARDLAAGLVKRIRTTDEIGWLEDGRLAVVLPHTAPDGAWDFLAHVRGSLTGNVHLPECRVYAYPSRWFDREGDGADAKEDPGETAGPKGNPAPARIATPLEKLEADFLRRIPAWKRAVDIAGAIMATILLSPLLAGVAILIKAVSPGPLLFKQERVGYLGRTFTLWKFRTMHVNADTGVHRQYLHDLIHSETKMTKLDNGRDKRIIPFGGILRATGIDELPQLLNVLRGEMSLIGPRPCLPYEAREFTSWQMRRFDTVPGLTGLWQVSGKNRTTFKEMMRFDIGYARRRAPLLDLEILAKTFPAVISQVLDRPALKPVRSTVHSILARAGTMLISLLAIVTDHK